MITITKATKSESINNFNMESELAFPCNKQMSSMVLDVLCTAYLYLLLQTCLSLFPCLCLRRLTCLDHIVFLVF